MRNNKNTNKLEENKVMNIKEWKNKVDELFIEVGIHPEHTLTTGKTKYAVLVEFYEKFLENGWFWESTHEDGIDVINYLMDRDNLPTIPTENFRGQVDDLIDGMENNLWLKEMKRRLINTRVKGKGVGELFLTLIFKGGVFDPDKDLCIFGEDWEVKNGQTGGCIKGNAEEKLRIIDKLVKKYFNGLNPYRLSKPNQVIYEEFSEWSETIDLKERVTGFMNDLYKNTDQSVVDSRIEIFMNTYQNRHKLNQMLGIDLGVSYQKIDGFKGLIVINPLTEEVVILKDFSDVEFINDSLKFTVQGRRGGDTNAVGDGYGKVFLNKSTKGFLENVKL